MISSYLILATVAATARERFADATLCLRLFDIGVERIDHGVNSLDDEGLTEEIVKRGMD